MNISTVNELIQSLQSLESAGELSIREQKFLKLAKAFKQLAAENVALKNAITDHSHSVHFCEVCGKDDPCSTDDVCYALKDIPATDRIVAGIKADGVEMFALMFAEEAIKDNNITTGWKARASRAASEYAELLREGAK
ncbi:hypothetical protein B5K12_18505 [Klebsiella pneumoniae subsp. pneumoniae]|uniref:hypothetical protein n=1 Tax=Klebsiella pneumoniae complex TaxID=3390273 RepID=UPI000B527279|nr:MULTISPECIES: hypothetical protein [Klebsiella]MDJ1081605.1 hypothetical protein [Klebsiella pneumoniae]OWU94754.1 hypothetical protein B5K12_18505 [Klebsiella pneumoniae subsp. pneumoniae]PLF77243.1 hypothetical protein B6I99_10750 [Klebsiella quasipneumoniae]HBT4599765.1 hypothetical protein [Klebsiella pneumoniae]HBV0552526.1 hypothetical protein [Klebsiella pneumoniae]